MLRKRRKLESPVVFEEIWLLVLSGLDVKSISNVWLTELFLYTSLDLKDLFYIKSIKIYFDYCSQEELDSIRYSNE